MNLSQYVCLNSTLTLSGGYGVKQQLQPILQSMRMMPEDREW